MGVQYPPADYFLPRSLTDGDFMWFLLRGLMMEGQQLTQTNSCRGRIRIAHFWTSYLASRVCFWNRPVALGTSGHPSSQTPSLAWHLSANGLYRVSSWTSSELIDKKVITNFSVAAIAINQPSFLGHVLAFHWLIYFWWFYARDFGRCEVEPHQWKTERSWRLHCCGLHWLQMLSSWNSEGNPPPRVKASWGLGDNFNNQIGEGLLSIYSPYVLNILFCGVTSGAWLPRISLKMFEAVDVVWFWENYGRTRDDQGESSNNWQTLQVCECVVVPIGSMYAIYGNIYHQYTPNVSIYTIHGSYGVV